MKPVILISLIAVASFCSCSKKSDTKPQSLNTVTIENGTYSTVVIGNQTWTSVNYNGPGGTNYDTDPNNPSYGKLYTFAEAQAVKIPSGWRLPTRDDFNKLFVALGSPSQQGLDAIPKNVAADLMSKSTWQYSLGTNSSGWNAVGTGVYMINAGPASHYLNKGFVTAFYTSTLYNVAQNSPYVVFVTEYPSDFAMAFDNSDIGPQDRISIRFVKDN